MPGPEGEFGPARPRISALWPRLLTALFGYLALSSFLAALLLAMLFVIRHPPATDESGKPVFSSPDQASLEALLDEPAARGAIVAAQVATALVVTFLATLALDRRRLGALGLSPGPRRLGTFAWGAFLGVLLAALVVLAVAAIGGRRLRWEAFGEVSPPTVVAAGVLLVLGTFAEEWLFRGYVFANVRAEGSALRAITASAVAFAMLHIDSAGGGFVSGANLFLLGILLGQLREVTGSVEAPLGLHLGWNLTHGMILGGGIAGFDPPSLFRISLYDLTPPLGGGEYGAEASLTATAALMAAALLLAKRFLPRTPE